MLQYTLTIRFSASRELTPAEQDSIVGAALVQVAEPVDENGNDLDADFHVELADLDRR